MKKYTLLRTSAIILEIVGYIILAGGVILGLLTFVFSYSILPKELKLFSSSVVSFIVFIIWMFAYGFPLILAHIIQVSLHAYDNTNLILQKLEAAYHNKKEEQHLIQSSANNEVAQWMKNNPGKGLNDYYSR